MVHRLPHDILLAVLRLLSARDVVRLCATCKALQALLSDRSVWHYALSRLLLHFPQPRLSQRLAGMTAEELKMRVLHSARLDWMWHKVDYYPRLVRNFDFGSAVEHVILVAGGNWLVVVLYDGSLQLHNLDVPGPAATMLQTLTENESISYLSSHLSLTNDREDLIVLRMSVRFNQCHIYVYHIAVVDPSPVFVLVGKVTVTGSVWCCASGGHILVYGLEGGGGDMILHVCPVGPQYADEEGPQVWMNIGPWSADEDFTISVLSESQLMLASQYGLFIYEIPKPDPESPPPDHPTIYSVRPIWTCTCDIGSGIYRISSFTIGAERHTPHPLVIAGTRALHVLRVSPDSQVDYHEVPYPFTTGPEYMGLGAVGLRRAVWDCTEGHNGSRHVEFRTYSLPRSVLDLGGDDQDFDAGELGMWGKLGSFSVSLDPDEHLMSLCLDESSGRVCLILNHITK